MKIKHLNKLKSVLEKLGKKYPETESDVRDAVELIDALLSVKE